MSVRPRRVRALELCGVGLLAVAIGFLVVEKVQLELLPELLWACHVDALVVAAGVLMGARGVWLVAAGALHMIGVGWPCYLIEIALHGTTVASLTEHVVTAALGALVLLSAPALPARALRIGGAFALHHGAALAALVWTDPRLNINEAHAPWLPGDPRSLPVLWATTALQVLVCVLVADVVLAALRARMWRMRARAQPRPAGD